MNWPERFIWIAFAVHAIIFVNWFELRGLMRNATWRLGLMLLFVLTMHLAPMIAFYTGLRPQLWGGMTILAASLVVFASVKTLRKVLVEQLRHDAEIEAARRALSEKLSNQESIATRVAHQLVNTRNELDYYKERAIASGAPEYSPTTSAENGPPR